MKQVNGKEACSCLLRNVANEPKSHFVESLCFVTRDCNPNSHKGDRIRLSVLLYECQSLQLQEEHTT